MNNKEPQHKTMPEHYLLCFNGDCVLTEYNKKDMKERYLDFDEYIKSLDGEYSQEELDEMKEVYHEEMRKGNVDWREYVTYKRIDVHPDSQAAKMGRPI